MEITGVRLVDPYLFLRTTAVVMLNVFVSARVCACADVELTKLAEGVNTLSVDVGESAEESKDAGAAAAGSPKREAEEDLLPDSPDYNDVNFWKPSMNWFDK